MEDILKSLKKFRLARNIDASQGYKFVLRKQVGFMVSEVSEFLDAENEFDEVDALCDISVFAINAHALLSEDFSLLFNGELPIKYCTIPNILDRFSYFFSKYTTKCDIEVRLIELIELSQKMLEDMGYDFKKCMTETIKEISSRKQDPIQSIEWQENGASGKWQKDKKQDASTIYKANYGICKVTTT